MLAAKKGFVIMSHPSLPRILGPNLGCPEIVALVDLHGLGFELLLAAGKSADAPGAGWSLHAVPSFAGEGAAFDLTFDIAKGNRALPWELANDALPNEFAGVSDTRRLTSTTLRSGIFGGKARFWIFRAKSSAVLPKIHFRQVGGQDRLTLYDLELRQDGECLHRVLHALCLRPPSENVRFAHITDLHVAERNDLWASEQASILPHPSAKFINFNEHARRFIRWANQQADQGKLDLVLALGDLVDFVEQGITQSQATPNNWQVLIAILTGEGNESAQGNPGLRVPVFTTLGNHDWRSNPYPPETEAEILGLSHAQAEQLDYVYRDTSEAVGKRIEDVHDRLVKEGSPILARSWWRSLVGFGLRGVTVFFNRLSSRLLAWANSMLRYVLYALTAAVVGGLGLGVGSYLNLENPAKQVFGRLWRGHPWSVLGAAVALCFLVWLAVAFVRDRLGTLLRRLVEGLIAIEKSLPGLEDYFLLLNPYFNYALRLEKCYFLILDTGHDCLTAQSFWDDGGKKIARLSVGDNVIGGSPDTMGFYPPNVYFPYSQIVWMERVLDCIRRSTHQKATAPRNCRVFVGLHSPPANLSAKERARADDKLATADGHAVLLQRKHWWTLGGYNVCYGTINHYLSQFYYLCLGVREEKPGEDFGCGVDVALAGHAHWCQEFKLARPQDNAVEWKPAVHYGTFAKGVEQAYAAANPEHDPAPMFGPLLLQTAGCGPPCFPKHGEQFPDPPYVRLISVEPNMHISTLAQRKIP
jgi:3',5'-cyclic AMP phosphodiesterase CpdA